jgi:hypothetical protein
MRRALVLSAIILVLTAPVFAGVVKKTKSDITFRGFGKFSVAQSEKLTADQKWMDSKSDFKGQGLMGGLAGKTVLRSGETGQIIDLPAGSIYQLDHKKREYTVSPIKPLSEEMKGGEKGKPAEKEEQQASTIKITRNEFKVEDTGEQSVINNFNVSKYLVHWLMEWEDTETGEKGSNTLDSFVWTTPMTDALRNAQEEELKFSKAYLQKIGVNADQMTQDVLGTSWLSLLDSFGKPGRKPQRDFSKASQEMQKVKGYPIVIDGKYSVTGTGGKQETATAEKEGEESPKDVKGALGGLLKKTMKKKPAPSEAAANEPALSYRIEVLEISATDLGAADFQVPATYKKKG